MSRRNSDSRMLFLLVMSTYIWLTEPATSGHSRSISSFRRRRAKERSAGSGSARKPTTPAAEVRPTIAGVLLLMLCVVL